MLIRAIIARLQCIALSDKVCYSPVRLGCDEFPGPRLHDKQWMHRMPLIDGGGGYARGGLNLCANSSR